MPPKRRRTSEAAAGGGSGGGGPAITGPGVAIDLPKHRRDTALAVRVAAAKLTYDRGVPASQTPNTDDGLPQAIGRFTKGLPHGKNGLVTDVANYNAFVAAITTGNFSEIAALPLGPEGLGFFSTTLAGRPVPKKLALRKWESPTAGHGFDLEGPDAQSLKSPPAPILASPELIAEISELYVMALLRDLDWDRLDTDPFALDLLQQLSTLQWFNGTAIPGLTEAEQARRRTIRVGGARGQGIITKPSDILRGIAIRDEKGPVVSQFLITFLPPRDFPAEPTSLDPSRDATIGQIREPGIRYGAIRIDPRIQVSPAAPARKATASKSAAQAVPEDDDDADDDEEISDEEEESAEAMDTAAEAAAAARPRQRYMGDYMTNWPQYLDVQNAAKFQDFQQFRRPAKYRFALTERDLATYVHYDQLYEAYLNAAIYLLEVGWDFDPGLPLNNQPTQAGFAHFGGPHILTLVTEVATRALKAVRYQKFQVHRRLRPEAVGGLMELIDSGTRVPKNVSAALTPLHQGIPPGIKDEVRKHNRRVNRANQRRGLYAHTYSASNTAEVPYRDDPLLLPMAFAEGSPMHPAYGAGHATVAGACVTVLKAWFDHTKTFDKSRFFTKVYKTNTANRGRSLSEIPDAEVLTLEGELNKLAANIANARNMAGVHYFSDYHSSMLLGEEVALELLREQKLTYPEKFTMTVPRFFTGENVVI